MRARPFVVLLAVLLLAAPTRSQTAGEQPEATFGEELEVSEVLLDVVVTDNDGNVILGLQPEDFLVSSEGEEVALNSATFYSNRRLLDAGLLRGDAGIDPADVPVDRYFILFFHDQRAENPDLTSTQVDAVRWARQWAESSLLANDWVAVLSYDFKLKVHQDFTTDREAIDRALKNVATGKDPGNVWPSRLAEASGPSLRENLPQGRELSRATRRVYAGLETVADAAGYVIGRKNLLLFSVGFGNLNDFGTYIPDERYYPPMMQALNDNNVAVYSISMLREASPLIDDQGTVNNVLSLLSDDTGGRFYLNFANFSDPLEQVVDDNSGYYLLSFAARHRAGEQGYRQVEVSTRNPGFKVRARKGYRYGT